jgi:hypothetical protein
MKPALLLILVVVLVQNAICGSKHDPQPENATDAVLRPGGPNPRRSHRGREWAGRAGHGVVLLPR